MFTKLVLQNFKAWRGSHALELKPLTLVLGVNSAGKSSLLQPLLLLKQTVESPDRLQALNFGGQPGDLLDLGTLSGVVSDHVMSEPEPKTKLAFRLTFGPVTIGKEAEPRTIPSVEYEVDYGAADDGIPYVQRLSYFTDAGFYAAARLPDGKYQLSAPNNPPAPDGRRTGRTYEPERSVGFSADAVAALGTDGPDAQDLALALTRELQQIAYLGPYRSMPSRSYAWTGRSPGQIGSSGEHAIPALIASLAGRHADEAERGRLVTQVSTWLARLGVADKLELERQGTLYQVLVTVQGQRENLLDVGFGVSQVLPVLTLAHFAPAGSTIVMSEPELHLHPLAQSGLADLLVEVARERKVQFLVETHSEHLFRRIQTLIAEERTTPAECSMLFALRKDGESVLEPLRVNDYGRVANWPDKFFGDTAGEVEQQTRKTFERMRADRGVKGDG